MTTQNEVKHTQGPWHVGMRPGPIIYGAKGEQIADLRGHWQEDREHVENVRLIASAPEMLEMLYTVLPAVEESDEFNKPGKKLGTIVRNLIAKAEGRI